MWRVRYSFLTSSGVGVWNDDSIRSLLVSIARSFPVGAVMMLEAGGETRFKVRPIEGLSADTLTPDMAEKLILDGQQRLTSLTIPLFCSGEFAQVLLHILKQQTGDVFSKFVVFRVECIERVSDLIFLDGSLNSRIVVGYIR